MKKYILLLILICSTAFATIIEKPILSVNGSTATIKINNINVGISGFIVKNLSKNHTYIVKNAVVITYNKKSHIAALRLSKYTQLKQSYLPSLNLKVTTTDYAYLAFAYDRALLIAPNKTIYYRVTQALPSLEWIDPDQFATLLSVNGHPTPLKDDFKQVCTTSAIGLLYFYINKNLFTVDCNSMKILQIAPASLKQTSIELPFFNQIGRIQSNWFGSGKHHLKKYSQYYLSLLVKNNQQNKQLYNFIKLNKKFIYLLNDFKLKDNK